MYSTLRVGYLQFRPQFGKVGRNLRHPLGMLADIRADLIVLPESPFTGYLFADRAEVMALAEDTRNAPTLAARLKSIRRWRAKSPSPHATTCTPIGGRRSMAN